MRREERTDREFMEEFGIAEGDFEAARSVCISILKDMPEDSDSLVRVVEMRTRELPTILRIYIAVNLGLQIEIANI